MYLSPLRPVEACLPAKPLQVAFLVLHIHIKPLPDPLPQRLAHQRHQRHRQHLIQIYTSLLLSAAPLSRLPTPIQWQLASKAACVSHQSYPSPPCIINPGCLPLPYPAYLPRALLMPLDSNCLPCWRLFHILHVAYRAPILHFIEPTRAPPRAHHTGP